MEKKILVAGHIEVGGERGLIQFCGGVARALSATEYKDPQKTIRKIDFENIIPENRTLTCTICKPLNPMPDGTCRTIKYQYFKTSIANFVSQGSFGATGVLRKYERK